MTTNEKILESLKSAVTYLGNSMLALNKKDENSFSYNIWHVAAELEYALFMFSITFQNESSRFEWKPNPELKKTETDSVLFTVQNLINESEKCVTDGKLFDAYKSVYIARRYVLRVQEDLAKKKREALKKK